MPPIPVTFLPIVARVEVCPVIVISVELDGPEKNTIFRLIEALSGALVNG